MGLLRKIIKDTLTNPDGKFSRKSITAFASFNFAIAFEASCIWLERGCQEYVFEGLLLLCATCLGLTVWDKK